MKTFELPKEIMAKWIWLTSLKKRENSYTFIRSTFTLDMGGGQSADLWISAHSSYHLFVNGRHLGYGPPPISQQVSYAVQYDMSFYLETGVNVIGILAHHTNCSHYSHFTKEPGVWCQLNIDNTPTAWTSENSKILESICYKNNVPYSAPGMEFVETVDLSAYPENWTESEYDDSWWDNPDSVREVGDIVGRLNMSPLKPSILEEFECPSILRGNYQNRQEITHVSFNEIFLNKKGAYAAQTYIESPTDKIIAMSIISESSFKIFLNEQLLTYHNPPNLNNQIIPRLTDKNRFGNLLSLNIKIRLKKGWNRLLLIQQNEKNGFGFFIAFPGIKLEELKIFTRSDNTSTNGWMLAGPLKLPLSYIYTPLILEKINHVIYTPGKDNINDASAFIGSCDFTKTQQLQSQTGDETVVLNEGEYVIYDAENILFGFPFLDIDGKGGDIVDITYGHWLEDGKIKIVNSVNRNTDTLILREENNTWMRHVPRSARYLMISVRKCVENVTVNRTVMMEFFREQTNTTLFESSDPVYNEIWEISRATLRRNANNIFLDSCCGHQCQVLADSMIQALATIYTNGDYDLSEKALREFAYSQYENGNLPAIYPSGIYYFAADFALLWAVWLDYHLQLTGNQNFKDEMLPYLDNLLSFYKTIRDPRTNLLVDIYPKYKIDCFIDYVKIDDRGMIVALNALYCRALLSSANIYDYAKEETKAESCRKEAAKIVKEVSKVAWDNDKGLFADCFSKGKLSDKHSCQTNLLALYSGMIPFDKFDDVFNKFFSNKKPYEKDAESQKSIYFKFFIIETMFALGKSEWTLGLIKDFWGGMLSRGAKTWWKFFDPNNEENNIPDFDLCHGYGVLPNIYLIRELAGIRAAEPGFTSIFFNPAYKIVDRLKVSFPTPYGRIHVEWQKTDDELDIKIDSSYPLNVVPILDPEIIDNTTLDVGQKVNILAPEATDTGEAENAEEPDNAQISPEAEAEPEATAGPETVEETPQPEQEAVEATEEIVVEETTTVAEQEEAVEASEEIVEEETTTVAEQEEETPPPQTAPPK